MAGRQNTPKASNAGTGDASSAAAASPAAQAPPLRTDGPTLDEYVKAGYSAENYPPQGYAAREAAPVADPPPAADLEGWKVEMKIKPQDIYPWPIPSEYAERQGVEMLMEACTLYGIDPSKEAHPVQLLDWKFYVGDRRRRVPDRVILVTAGGLKVAHPADEPTIERLRRVFHCFKEKKSKDGSVEIEILDLPDDLTIPSVHVDGQVPSGDHVYQRGYLKEGGAGEAARRTARRNAGLP